MQTFDDFKKRIDLVDYAKTQGWEEDKAKSTSRAVVLDKVNEGQSVDTIVVYRGKDHDYFYTPNHDREKGDVISFERYKNGTDWKDMNEKLSRYLGEVNQPRAIQEPVAPRHSHNEAFQHNFRFQPLTNTDYLESRGISKETLYADEFKDRIFNRTFSYKEYLETSVNQLAKQTSLSDQDKQNIQAIGQEKYYSKPFFDQLKSIQEQAKETGQLPEKYLESLRNTYGYKAPEGVTDRQIVNTSFPLRNEENVVAAINRNSEYNRVEMPKGNAVWSSRTDFDQRPVTSVIIHESPVDSLSYHQINPPRADEKRLYVATAGNMSLEQPVLIEKLIRESKAATIVLGNDNDRGGIVHNINQAGRLNLSAQSENLHARLNVTDRTDGRLLITLHHASQQEGLQRAGEVGERFCFAINKSIPAGVDKEAKATVLRNSERSTEVEVAFVVNRENLIRVEQTLIKERGLENNVQVKRPIEKDYNDDLKRATPFVVAYKEQNGREIVAGRYTKEADAYQAIQEKAQEKPDARAIGIYTEIKTGEGNKKVELATYDKESQRMSATPEFEKRVADQQQEAKKQAEIEVAKAKAGDIKMVDGDGNTVARTEYQIQVNPDGKTTINKEQQFDQEELTRERTSGDGMKTQMNQEVATATSRGADKGGVDGQDLKDNQKDYNQDQNQNRSLSR